MPGVVLRHVLSHVLIHVVRAQVLDARSQPHAAARTHLTNASHLAWCDTRQDEDERSPLDAIDEVIFFAQAWDGIEAGQATSGLQEKMLKALDEGQRTFMHSILATVPQRLAMQQAHLSGAAAALAGGAGTPGEGLPAAAQQAT